MSKIDDFEEEIVRLALLQKDVKNLREMKVEDISVIAAFYSSPEEAIGLLVEVLRRDETKILMNSIIEARRTAARNAAVDECQSFLRKHVVQEVMEG